MNGDSRVQPIVDELEIRNQISRLAHLADEGSLNEYIEMFTSDATWGGGGQPLRRGHDEIMSGAQSRRDSGVVGPGTTARHVISTTWVDVCGDLAYARSVFHFYTGIDAEPVLRAMGVYDDTFTRRPRGWLLSKRNLIGSANDITAKN
jgi:hypothetical protein